MKVNIIGIGSVGCKVASWFKQYPKQYRTLFIDTVKYGTKSLLLPKCSTHEDFEQQCPDFSDILGRLKGKTFIFLTGANRASGVTLRVLSSLKNNENNTIVYIQTENDSNLIFGVLQEYTRSGLFEDMIILSNKSVEKAFDGISVVGYFDTINDYMANLVDNYNYFQFNDPVFFRNERSLRGVRISTLSVVDMDSQMENKLFDLDFVSERRYSFGVSKEILETDKTYLNKVKNFLNTVNPNKEIRINYAIYQMEGGKNVALCCLRSSEIQVLR